jgi:hypothetical protein
MYWTKENIPERFFIFTLPQKKKKFLFENPLFFFSFFGGKFQQFFENNIIRVSKVLRH